MLTVLYNLCSRAVFWKNSARWRNSAGVCEVKLVCVLSKTKKKCELLAKTQPILTKILHRKVVKVVCVFDIRMVCVFDKMHNKTALFST